VFSGVGGFHSPLLCLAIWPFVFALLGPDMTKIPTELLVCVKCLKGGDAPEEGVRPGEVLHAAIADLPQHDGVTVTAVECLQNCDHGCTVALRGGDARWTYVFGNVDEASHPEMILDGAAQYHDTADGVIPWRQRPEHFKRNCVARIPPITQPDGA